MDYCLCLWRGTVRLDCQHQQAAVFRLIIVWHLAFWPSERMKVLEAVCVPSYFGCGRIQETDFEEGRQDANREANTPRSGRNI